VKGKQALPGSDPPKDTAHRLRTDCALLVGWSELEEVLVVENETKFTCCVDVNPQTEILSSTKFFEASFCLQNMKDNTELIPTELNDTVIELALRWFAFFQIKLDFGGFTLVHLDQLV